MVKDSIREDHTVDVTPLSHPVNAVNYFRDISALYSPYPVNEDEGGHDSTLSELLSPLEIRPDY